MEAAAGGGCAEGAERSAALTSFSAEPQRLQFLHSMHCQRYERAAAAIASVNCRHDGWPTGGHRPSRPRADTTRPHGGTHGDPIGTPRRHGGTPQGAHRDTGGHQREPIGTRGGLRGTQRDTGGPRREPIGTRGDPIGSHRDTGGHHREPIGTRGDTWRPHRKPIGSHSDTGGPHRDTGGHRREPIGTWGDTVGSP